MYLYMPPLCFLKHKKSSVFSSTRTNRMIPVLVIMFLLHHICFLTEEGSMNVKALKTCFLLTSISVTAPCHADFCASSRRPENTVKNIAWPFLSEPRA